MGTWGFGILQDDTVTDIVGFVVDLLKGGQTIDSATDRALSHFAELADDADEAPLLWIAFLRYSNSIASAICWIASFTPGGTCA